MKKLLFFMIPLIFLSAVSDKKRAAVYHSLQPDSISSHLAFYELYPNTKEGQDALSLAWKLLTKGDDTPNFNPSNLINQTDLIDGIIKLINRKSSSITSSLTEQQIELIEKISSHLPNRKLKGYAAKTEEDVLALKTDEVDLAHGLLLSQGGLDPLSIREYEALIDLMALQVLASTSLEDPPEVKIRALNELIFHKLKFRFPPHSLFAKEIDLYTFLPSVLDTRRGVCLGVSILYLSLAQRLDLPLEMITPPGHIYIRYNDGKKVINIETTARGIHMDSKEYLGIATRSLQQRTIKEVIGLAHFNQASVFWQREEYGDALLAYQAAEKYLPGDKLLDELYGYNLLFTGKEEKGRKRLEKIRNYVADHAITNSGIAEDYLNGNGSIEGIQAVFKSVDETRESILEKRQLLEEVLEKHPKFRAGIMALAVCWLQLHRANEALEWLEKYHVVDPYDPTVEYYLAVLQTERRNYKKAWKHIKQTETILSQKNHNPRALQELKQHLSRLCPASYN